MPSASQHAGVRLAHQKILLEIDFSNQELRGSTTLTLQADPVFPDKIVLDCADQCVIQNLLVNDNPVPFVLR